jgi:alpha-ketoglutarate-dependent taurine dioxygenase
MTTASAAAQQASDRGQPAAPVRTRRLSAALGLEVLDVDLREPLPEARIAQLREAWYEGQILLLRDQALSEDDQVRFAEYFGPPAKTGGIRPSC